MIFGITDNLLLVLGSCQAALRGQFPNPTYKKYSAPELAEEKHTESNAEERDLD